MTEDTLTLYTRRRHLKLPLQRQPAARKPTGSPWTLLLLAAAVAALLVSARLVLQ